MSRLKWFVTLFSLVLFSLVFLFGSVVVAQDDEAEESAEPTATPTPEPTPLLEASVFDIAAYPNIDLLVIAQEVDGEPVDLSRQFIAVRHNGELSDDVRYVGEQDVGTFTIFLLDLPPGVDAELEPIQEALVEFAADPNMKEGVDYVGVYQVGEGEPRELLEPTSFYNAMQNLVRTQPLEVDGGPTALVDTMVSLLGQVDDLQPEPQLRPSIVLMTDGTDAISQNTLDALLEQAGDAGVPVHTVAIGNVNLPAGLVQLGEDYLAQLSEASDGIGRNLADPDSLNDIWNNIAAQRTDSIVRYLVPEPEAGSADIEVTLPDSPGFPPAATAVTIPGNIPTIVFANEPILDEDGEVVDPVEIGVDSIENPLRLRVQTTVRWLDDELREIVAAQVIFNGTPGQVIDPAELDDFVVELDTYRSGANTLAVTIEDEAGRTATTGDLRFNVTEGSNAIPDPLQPPISLITWVFIILLAAGGLLLLIYLIRALLNRSRERDERPAYVDPNPKPKAQSEPTVVVEQEAVESAETPVADETPEPAPEVAFVPPAGTPIPGAPAAFIEVLEAQTNLPRQIAITRPEYNLGRGTTADLEFRDDPTVSRIHCTIVQDGDVYRLFDQESTSGTLVNGAASPIMGTELKDKDELTLGAVRLRFRQF